MADESLFDIGVVLVFGMSAVGNKNFKEKNRKCNKEKEFEQVFKHEIHENFMNKF